MSQRDEDIAAWIDLNLVPGLGPAQYRALLSAFGLPHDILRLRREHLARVIPDKIAAAITAGNRNEAVEKGLAWATQPGNSIITLADALYPSQLLEIPDPPPLLYCRGNRALLGANSLAVVGSRNATPQGASNAEVFSRAVSGAGLTIVSGLALGIDAAAHRGGLAETGSTIAVVGTGPDTTYPKGNTSLAMEIAAKGLLISEFPLGTPPLAANFPRRNRLIAGLSRGVLVVEAALASGSLITARMAVDQGREVFAIPGSIHSPVSKGCHALIRQGAKLVESAEDILVELQFSLPGRQPTAPPKISGANGVLLQYIGYDPCDISTLAARSGLTAEAVSGMLLELELEGRVGSLPGGFYQRLM
jgi:DNA processing protein